jgi:hypothetical protein
MDPPCLTAEDAIDFEEEEGLLHNETLQRLRATFEEAYAAPFFWITCKCFVVCPADPLCITFMKSLSLAFFVTDPEDVATMKTWLKNVRGMTDEAIQNLPMSYFHKRCRRYIPPPLQLARRLRCEL